MKFKNILLITLILLTILTIGAVSASDNDMSDDLAVNEETVDEISQVGDVDLIADSDGSQEDAVGDGEKVDLEFDSWIPDRAIIHKGGFVSLGYRESSATAGPVTGNVSIYIDDMDNPVYNELAVSSQFNSNRLLLDEVAGLQSGKHNVLLKFFNDSRYNDYSINSTFDYCYYIHDPLEGIVDPRDAIIDVWLVDGVTGNLTVTLDGVKVVDSVLMGDEDFRVKYDVRDAGQHTYSINYAGNYPSIYESHSFIIRYMDVVIQPVIAAGDVAQFIVRLPSDAKQNAHVRLNGKDYEMEIDEMGNQVLNTYDYKLGRNNVTFSYQDEKYPYLEINRTFAVEPVINVSGVYAYNGTGEVARFAMPRDATGSFVIYKDNKTNKIGEVKLVNGAGTYSFSYLPIEAYHIIISYEGDDYELDDKIINLRIVPNIKIPESVRVDDTYNITILVNPDDDGQFELSCYPYIANSSENVNGIITIPLKLDVGDGQEIMVRYWRDHLDFYEVNQKINVKNSSSKWVPDLQMPDNINLTNYCGYDSFMINITNLLEDGDGTFYITVNGESKSVPIKDYESLARIPYGWLNNGTNVYSIAYMGDSYYNPWELNGTINAYGELKPNFVPDYQNDSEIIMADDWEYGILFSFDIVSGMKAFVRIDIDGVMAYQKYLGGGLISSEYTNYNIAFRNLTIVGWKAGQHNCSVLVWGDVSSQDRKVWEGDFSFTLFEQQIAKNDTVSIEIIPTTTIVNDNDTLIVIKADDNSGNVVIYVDDGKTPIILPLAGCRYDGNAECYMIGSKELNLGAGNHKLKVSYPGEGEKAINLTGNVTLVTSSISVDDVVFDYGGTGISNFVVEHGTVDLANVTVLDSTGKVVSDAKIVLDGNKILISNLASGKYTLKVIITPEDGYLPQTGIANITVNKLKTQITASAVTTTYDVNKYFVVTLKDSNGSPLSGAKVTVNLNGAKTYATDKNGQIKVNVATLVPKTYSAKITFAGDDKYIASTATAKVVVKKAKSTITAKKKTFKKGLKVKKYTITLKSGKKAIKKVQVTLKVKGKTYKAKTTAKGKATFKIKKLTKKGKYAAKITFKGNKYYNKATKSVKITIK